MKVDPLTLKFLLESMSEGIREIFLILSAMPNNSSLDELARIAHKLKGEATVVGFAKLTCCIGALEDSIQLFRPLSCLSRRHVQILARQLKPVVSECERIRKTALNALGNSAKISKPVNPAKDIASTLTILTQNVSNSCGKSVQLTFGRFQLERLPVRLQKKIQDIAVQLIRNAVVHGIESVNERIALGKPVKGHVCILVQECNGLVTLDVRDDGRGVVLEKIRRRLIIAHNQSVKKVASMSRQSLLDALFLPGFSTLSNVQSDAGRGVGLDLVKNTVVQFGGDVSVRYRKNTFCQFTVKIPIKTKAANDPVPLLVNAVMPNIPLLLREV